ncbi:hypothetical protein ACTL6U_05975 [Rhodovibrionaceae bacterium A322]
MTCHRTLSYPYQRLSGYSLMDLDHGEQLLVWASRRWLSGKPQWKAVEMEYALSLGQKAGPTALLALEQLLSLLRHHAKRTLFLNRASSGQLSSDEVRLLNLLALTQMKEESAELSWRFMVQQSYCGEAALKCRLLAECFLDANMTFDLRTNPPQSRTEDVAAEQSAPFLIAGQA